MNKNKKSKIHLQIQDFLTICGAHRTAKDYLSVEDLEKVTCGNCLRKLSVFKWTPESPKRTKLR